MQQHFYVVHMTKTVTVQCTHQRLLQYSVHTRRIATVLGRKLSPCHYLMVTLTMTMSSYGLSVRPFVLAFEMFCTTSIPFVTLPNTVCLLSSHGCHITQQTSCIEIMAEYWLLGHSEMVHYPQSLAAHGSGNTTTTTCISRHPQSPR